MAQASAEQTLYRWVDDEGIVHYSDHVPQVYSSQDLDVLNSQGVAVRHVEGAATEEELAARARLAALGEAEAVAALEQARNDKVLLDTYLSIEDIERLRDRRLGLLGSQLNATELYLENLIKRLSELQLTAQNFRPYSDNPDARPVPQYLELDMTRTADAIKVYEETLGRSRDQHETLTEAFARDIQRFQELTGS
ncbi:MAG: DUF4124 domain-containing protein [Gammaproteobacteria bacterium]